LNSLWKKTALDSTSIRFISRDFLGWLGSLPAAVESRKPFFGVQSAFVDELWFAASRLAACGFKIAPKFQVAIPRLTPFWAPRPPLLFTLGSRLRALAAAHASIDRE